MDSLLQFLDSWTERVPASVVKWIQFSALGVWLLLAVWVILYSYNWGVESTPPTGMDMSRAGIKEKMERAKNLKSRRPINIPEIRELLSEEELKKAPYPRSGGRRGEGRSPEYRSEGHSGTVSGPYLPQGVLPSQSPGGFQELEFETEEGAGAGVELGPGGGGESRLELLPVKP